MIGGTIHQDITVKNYNIVSYLLQATEINQAACNLAREVAEETGGLVAAGITHLPSYAEGEGKEFLQREFRKQTDVFVQNGVDFIIAEVK